jgi:predicted nuclease of predicted toxin-antitoxin system
MRRVLVDECLPVQLHRWLDGFDVRTVAFMGWKGKRNGELLAAAQGKFDMLLTNDRFLPREHDPRHYAIGIVVLTTNRLSEVERLVPEIAQAVTRISSGEVIRVPARRP